MEPLREKQINGQKGRVDINRHLASGRVTWRRRRRFFDMGRPALTISNHHVELLYIKEVSNQRAAYITYKLSLESM